MKAICAILLCGMMGLSAAAVVACCPPPIQTVDVEITNPFSDFGAPNSRGKFAAVEACRIGNFGTLKVGLHFTDVTIPQGSTILSAKLVVTPAAPHYGNEVHVKILAADEDDPTCPTTLIDSNSRPRTTASTAWQTDFHMVEGVWEPLDSPDFTAVIQELVDRPGFGSDRVLIYIEDDGSDVNSFDRFRSADFGEDFPRLVIEYQ
jgi:hypothetical protein